MLFWVELLVFSVLSWRENAIYLQVTLVLNTFLLYLSP